ncbi:hypothetical protein B0T14DRAFT_184175 [Immersiella caudata]|uniref:Uncharacterized protein n=1 Tax=Immersiella caudata TaxID=314043 RepID=A0AA39WXU6_9PEZI|nr:hypothetical protein B0T14DRAFT_184175 [Immersiella caudata]
MLAALMSISMPSIPFRSAATHRFRIPFHLIIAVLLYIDIITFYSNPAFRCHTHAGVPQCLTSQYHSRCGMEPTSSSLVFGPLPPKIRGRASTSLGCTIAAWRAKRNKESRPPNLIIFGFVVVIALLCVV